MERHPSNAGLGTPFGLLAILIWSTTFAVARSLTESLGFLTTGACAYGAGGLVACAAVMLNGSFGAMFRLPGRYLGCCGALFAAYTVLVYVAVGTAPDRTHAAVVTVINYLWPALTLVFSIPLAGERARWTLWPGVSMALAGTFLAVISVNQAGLSAAAESLRAGALPYACAAAAAIAWALYSNLSRRYGAKEAGAVPLFLLASGIILAAARLLRPEQSVWTAKTYGELAYMALFPAAVAYVLWDRGMRTGNFLLLASASYFAPVLGTLWMVLYLGVPGRAALWIGCALVTAGAFVCRFSFRRD